MQSRPLKPEPHAQADYAINLTRPSDEKSTANMEKAATIIARAVNNCISDRTSPPDESRKWGIYYIVGLVLKCYFRVGGLVGDLLDNRS
jgi:hypothetical protein